MSSLNHADSNKRPAAEKPIVLVIDDMPAIIDIYRKSLQSDFRIKVATCGKAAIKAAITEPLPSCILLDVMMPDIDGYAICRKLRAHSISKSIPIIFVTSKTSKKDEILGFDSGANDFITKPVSPDQLKSRVHAQLHSRHTNPGDLDAEHRPAATEESLSAIVDNFSELLTSSTPETINSMSDRDQSMKTLLQNERFTGDWALRLASMIQASLAPDLNDEPSQASARKKAIEQVTAIPDTKAPEQVFNRIDSDTAQSLGTVLLKAAEMTSHNNHSTDTTTIAHEMALNAIKLLQQPLQTARPRKAVTSKPRPALSQHNISIRQLKPGMIAYKNIRTTQGATVIPAKTTISAAMINQLHTMQRNSTHIEEPIAVAVPRKDTARNNASR